MEDKINSERILVMRLDNNRTDNVWFLAQEMYIDKVFNLLNMADAKYLGVLCLHTSNV